MGSELDRAGRGVVTGEPRGDLGDVAVTLGDGNRHAPLVAIGLVNLGHDVLRSGFGRLSHQQVKTNISTGRGQYPI